MATLSDHQDSDLFSYERTWEEMEAMLDKAERTLNFHQMKMLEFRPKSKKWVEHARNFKALQSRGSFAHRRGGKLPLHSYRRETYGKQ